MNNFKPIYDHMIQFFPKGNCITFLLNNTGITGHQIAQKANVNYSYVSLMVHGKRPITDSVRKVIHETIGFDPFKA